MLKRRDIIKGMAVGAGAGLIPSWLPLLAQDAAKPGAEKPAAAKVPELLPKHITPAVQACIGRGLDYLAKEQGNNGGWDAGPDGVAYPITTTSLAGMALLANGNTPSRGKYADSVKRCLNYLMQHIQGGAPYAGLITGPGREQGRPMYGHGFALMFFGCVYGMVNDDRIRERLHKIIVDGVRVTSESQAGGGWTYNPGDGDEGSVTVTQIQALRACHDAGFKIPKGTIENAVKYIQACKTPAGGIRYSFNSSDEPRLAISCAAVATLYNAGQFDAPVAEDCLEWVWKRFESMKGQFTKRDGHDFYAHLYASQAFYMAGDEYWNGYFPTARDQIVQMQQSGGFWSGDGIGNIYGTSIALIILQLPYKFLPVFQR